MNNNRRQFLKQLAVGAATVTVLPRVAGAIMKPRPEEHGEINLKDLRATMDLIGAEPREFSCLRQAIRDFDIKYGFNGYLEHCYPDLVKMGNAVRYGLMYDGPRVPYKVPNRKELLAFMDKIGYVVRDRTFYATVDNVKLAIRGDVPVVFYQCRFDRVKLLRRNSNVWVLDCEIATKWSEAGPAWGPYNEFDLFHKVELFERVDRTSEPEQWPAELQGRPLYDWEHPELSLEEAEQARAWIKPRYERLQKLLREHPLVAVHYPTASVPMPGTEFDLRAAVLGDRKLERAMDERALGRRL